MKRGMAMTVRQMPFCRVHDADLTGDLMVTVVTFQLHMLTLVADFMRYSCNKRTLSR